MGKTSAPLTFLTSRDFYGEHEKEFEELAAKGHQVNILPRPMDDGSSPDPYYYDIMLDPKAWRTWTDPVTGRIANLDMAIKAARVAKKLREKKK